MNKIIKIWCKVEESILVFLISVMGLALFLQVCMRFLFNNALPWPEEFARFAQIWIMFIGIGYGVRTNAHVGMNLFSEKYSFKVKRIVDIISNSLGVFISWVLLQSSLSFLTFQNSLSTAMRVPMYIVYSIIPISGALCIIYYVAFIIKSIQELIRGSSNLDIPLPHIEIAVLF